ncbi:unnamed protein product [Adineta steineri]|uniref:Autophagy-related protein 9 n=1 Tax=Adineta steineri TaxID=433720 RepID=A0A818I7K6_9BILA|nr:unnamed protein product [Adineta steineri]
MEYRPVNNEENDTFEGQDQTLSPYMQFETQDESTHEKQSKWSHQKDLDDFFVRIYQYHQKHGFFCIVLSEIFGLMYVKLLN